MHPYQQNILISSGAVCTFIGQNGYVIIFYSYHITISDSSGIPVPVQTDKHGYLLLQDGGSKQSVVCFVHVSIVLRLFMREMRDAPLIRMC